jgi:two-component system CheB/CheR fusion protein
VTDINLPVEIPSLDKLVGEVFDTLTPKDLELQDRQGHWWSVRIRAYKTTDHKIEGAVLALVDIDAIKASMQRLAEARDFGESILNTVREPFLVLDNKLNVVRANRAFYRQFKVKPDETISRRVYELGNHQWDIPELKNLLEDILPQNSAFDDFSVEHDFPRIGKKRMLLNARRLQHENSHLILLAMEEMKE